MKKMNHFLVLASFVFLAIGLSGCLPTQEIDASDSQATLSVGEETVVFPNSGGNKTISVSGATKWEFISNAGDNDWQKIERKGDGLEITVMPNLKGKERKASIIVLAGNSQRKIDITQSAADYVLDFSDQHIVFNNKGGDKVVMVSSNSEAWTLDALGEDAAWLKVTGQSGADMMVLEAQENPTYKDREATLYFTFPSGEKKDLHVVQKGIAKYFMPYDAPFDYNPIDLFFFENQRGNILQSYTEPTKSPTGGEEAGVTLFITTSDYMPVITYTQELETPKYTSARMPLFYTNELRSELEEYATLLQANDYTEQKSKAANQRVFMRKDGLMLVGIELKTDMAMVNFLPQYPQTESMPTFNHFPRPAFVDELLDKKDVKPTQVMAWEKKQNGSELYITSNDKEDSTLVSNLMFKTGSTDREEAAQRGYYFYGKADTKDKPEFLESVQELAFYYTDMSLAIRKVGRTIYVTKEFSQLIADNGYTFLRERNGSFFYAKRINKQQIEVFYVAHLSAGFTNILDGSECLNIGFFHMDMPETSASQHKAALSKARSTRTTSIDPERDAVMKKIDAFLNMRKRR